MELNVSLSPEIIFYIGSFPVTNTFFWTVFMTLFLFIFFTWVSANLKDKPSRIQNAVELLIGEGYDFIKSIIGTDQKTRRVFPLVMTMFIFILVSNLATFIPGQAAIELEREEGPVAVFRAVMSDYGLVLVMTLVAVLTTQIVSIFMVGPFGYLGKYINFKSPLQFFLGLMDLVGEIAKVLSMSFRLFGNIFAGEVLAMVMLFLFPFFTPLPFMFLSLLVAVVQAFVFAMLTLVFISMATEMESSETEEGHQIN